jgi:hypothetical protein
MLGLPKTGKKCVGVRWQTLAGTHWWKGLPACCRERACIWVICLLGKMIFAEIRRKLCCSLSSVRILNEDVCGEPTRGKVLCHFYVFAVSGTVTALVTVDAEDCGSVVQCLSSMSKTLAWIRDNSTTVRGN